ncbi:hypothetical protein BH10PSE13_BH10PSE13_15960 [soil metagenome]
MPVSLRPIAGLRSAWRLWSVRLSTASAALMATWTSLPPELRASLPYANHLAAGLFLAVALSRLIAQEDEA